MSKQMILTALVALIAMMTSGCIELSGGTGSLCYLIEDEMLRESCEMANDTYNGGSGAHNGGNGFISEIWDGVATEAGQLEIAVQANDLAYTWAVVEMVYDYGANDLYGYHEVDIRNGWVEFTTPQAMDEGYVKVYVELCTNDGLCIDAFSQGSPQYSSVEVYKNYNAMQTTVMSTGTDPYLKAHLNQNL